MQWFGAREGLALDADALAENENGDIWIGYDGAGAVRLSASEFQTFDRSEGLPTDQVASMTFDSEGSLLVTTDKYPGSEVCRIENGRFVRQNLGVPGQYWAASWVPWHEILLDDGHGAWWMASARGLLQLAKPVGHQSARLLHRHTTTDGLPSNDVGHVFCDFVGNIWFSTLSMVWIPPPGRQSGLGMWERKTGRIHTFTAADGLPPLNSFAILYLFQDHSGQIWVGLYRKGLARYRNGRFQLFSNTEGVPAGGVRFIYEDQLHRLWIGSGRGGLGMIEDPAADRLSIRHFSFANGLSSDEVQALTGDDFGRIYVGTGLGVDRLDPVTGQITHFTHADGLAEGEVQDAVRDRNGDLWFGTYHGISRLHPVPDVKMNALPSIIVSIKVNGRVQPTTLGARQVTLPSLPPGNNGVEIEFLALTASDTNNIRYQYRLNGGKEPWGAPTASRTVTYSNLRPGTYTFEVRSLGDSPSPAATVHFAVLPHFWETWPFLISVVAVVLAVLYTVYRYRLTNLLRIQQVRTRIANDLHDDIGSGLSKIVILSEVVRRDQKNSHAAALDSIAEGSREVLATVDDLVWTTNAHTETAAVLVRRMRSFATQLCEAKGIEFEMCTIDLPMEKTLPPDCLRHLYLIFKEAVNNAVKHSRCSSVRVALRYELGTFGMQVSDDGTGVIPAAKPGHHGLENLKVRATQLKGTIEWRVESGTTVELNIPCLFR